MAGRGKFALPGGGRMTRARINRWHVWLRRVRWYWWIVGGALLAGGILLGFDMASRQEGKKREGRRGADLGFLLFERQFKDLDVIVWASELQGEVAVYVQLYRPRASASRCFTAPPDLRISMNGLEMTQRSAGGRKATERLMGIPVPFTSCRSVVYGLQMTRESALSARRASVLVESGKRHGEITINTLLEPRGAVFEPALDEVTPGDRVSMKWTHSTDTWEGNSSSSYVWIHSERGSAAVKQNRGLVFDNGRFEFEFPELPPGRVNVTVALVDLVPRPAIQTCDGFGKCYAKSRIPLAVQVVNVLPRTGPLKTSG